MDCLGIIPSSGILTAVRYALAPKCLTANPKRAALKAAGQSSFVKVEAFAGMACVFDGSTAAITGG